MINIQLTEPHIYQIDWLKDRVIFSIDDQTIHASPYSPHGKMGIVIWIDNQYAIVTPQGRFGWGLIEISEPQWIDLYEWSITR